MEKRKINEKTQKSIKKQKNHEEYGKLWEF